MLDFKTNSLKIIILLKIKNLLNMFSDFKNIFYFYKTFF